MAEQIDILSVPVIEDTDNMDVLVNEHTTGEPFRIPAVRFTQRSDTAAEKAEEAAKKAEEAAKRAEKGGDRIYIKSAVSIIADATGGNLSPAWLVNIVDFDERLADFEKYRLCLMYRKITTHPRGYMWRTPMFYELHPHPNDIIQRTQDVRRYSTNITGTNMVIYNKIKSISLFHNLATWLENWKRPGREGTPLLNAKSWKSKCFIGVAVFKYTGVGQFGWQRISNIAGIKGASGGSASNDKGGQSVFGFKNLQFSAFEEG